jgi:hypothetical protein
MLKKVLGKTSADVPKYSTYQEILRLAPTKHYNVIYTETNTKDTIITPDVTAVC